MAEPRTLEIRVTTFGNKPIYSKGVYLADYVFKCRTPVPAILHVCYESQKVSLKYYTKAFRRIWPFKSNPPPQKTLQYTYIDFKKDTPCLFEDFDRSSRYRQRIECACLVLQEIGNPEEFRKMKRVAVPMPVLTRHLSLLRNLSFEEPLEEVIVMDQFVSNDICRKVQQHGKFGYSLSLLDFAEEIEAQKGSWFRIAMPQLTNFCLDYGVQAPLSLRVKHLHRRCTCSEA